MVDIHWEDHNQRSASQKRHRAHLRRHGLCTPRKPSGWDRGGDKPQPPMGGRGNCTHQTPGHLSFSDLGRAQNEDLTKSAPLWTTREPEPEWLNLGSACNPGPATDSSPQSNLEPEQCRLGKYTRCEQGQTQCDGDTASTPYTRQ